MRNPNGTLDGNLNDDLPALTSGSLIQYESSSLNENETVYDLLPVIINRPPIITASIMETSIPRIKPYASADASGDFLYYFPDDSVKVLLGSSFTLKLEAVQPSVLNVENGIPTMIPSNVGLTYIWKKDGNIITTYTIDSLQSTMTVDENKLSFVNIQPEHAGSYTCEVSNDIGTTVSEPINLEVINLDFDSYFYRNLVQNPYGKEGTDGWESTSTDFTTMPFSTIPSVEFRRQHKVNLFGYTPDMLHPRPYQIDIGAERDFDMTNELLVNGSYFTRTRYSYIKKGGIFLVRAYQDIDLTEIESLIKGGVWGVEGVRALFTCYIGSGLGPYIPIERLSDPVLKARPTSYVGNKPRLSIENFLNSGPNLGPKEFTYISLEEFANETRLSSTLRRPDGTTAVQQDRIVVYDPWKKRINNGTYWGQKYYGLGNYYGDPYQLGISSLGNGEDVTLFIADELMPNSGSRFTSGQYSEFNKVIIDKLNPKTTKVRITLHFETDDSNLFDTFNPTINASDEPFEFDGYQRPFLRHTFDTTNYNTTPAINDRIRDLPRNEGLSLSEYLPLSPDPRGMVTAVNFVLLPIFTENPELTNYYTDTIGSQNDTPESTVPDALDGPGRPYDPVFLNTTKLNIQFDFRVPGFTRAIDSNGVINNDGDLAISFSITNPPPQGSTTPITTPIPVNPNVFFPIPQLGLGDEIRIEDANVTTPFVKKFEGNTWTSYTSENPDDFTNQEFNSLFTDYYGTFNNSTNVINFPGSVDYLQQNAYTLVSQSQNVTDRITDSIDDTLTTWTGVARYQLYFQNPGAQNLSGDFATQPISTRAQTYFLELDFSNPSNRVVWLYRTDYQPTGLPPGYTPPGGSGVIPSSPQIALYPGYGTYRTPLAYNIDGSGVMHLKIPLNLITRSELLGGFGYVPERLLPFQGTPYFNPFTGQSQPRNHLWEPIIRVRDTALNRIDALINHVRNFYAQPEYSGFPFGSPDTISEFENGTLRWRQGGSYYQELLYRWILTRIQDTIDIQNGITRVLWWKFNIVIPTPAGPTTIPSVAVTYDPVNSPQTQVDAAIQVSLPGSYTLGWTPYYTINTGVDFAGVGPGASSTAFVMQPLQLPLEEDFYYWVWVQNTARSGPPVYKYRNTTYAPGNAVRQEFIGYYSAQRVRVPAAVATSFTVPELQGFLAKLTNYALTPNAPRPTLTPREVEMNNYFTGRLEIDLNDDAFKIERGVWNNFTDELEFFDEIPDTPGFNNSQYEYIYKRAEVNIDPRLNLIASASLTDQYRPSLLAVKSVSYTSQVGSYWRGGTSPTPATTDRIGSPSFFINNGNEYVVNYKPIKDSLRRYYSEL